MMNPNLSNLPLVSVIVRTVNRPIYLRECLQSIIQQDYRNLEVILVNDGGPSVQSIFETISNVFPSRLIELPFNSGRSFSGNLGLENSSGDFIGFLDDDDIYYPFHISNLVKTLIKTGSKVAYSDAFRADQVPAAFDSSSYVTTKHWLEHSQGFSRSELLRRKYIPILCPLFSRDCYLAGVRFDKSLEVLEDWDFWLQLADKWDFVYERKITAEYRVRNDGTNTLRQNPELWEWSRKYVREKHGAFLYKAA